MRILILSLALLFMLNTAQAAIIEKEISYHDGDTKLTGYLAYDDAIQGARPGVLVIHEWWGLNDYARKRARQLAYMGYTAFAIDMYGDGTTADTPDGASALAKPFYENRDLMRKRALAGLNILKGQAEADAERVGIIGFCFGGTVALEMARASVDVRAVTAFHAGLTTPAPAQKDAVKAALLVLNGAADPMSPEKDRKAFADEMNAASANFRMIDYPGALHAFTNPAATAVGKKYNLPVAYDADADMQSWQEMANFFDIMLE